MTAVVYLTYCSEENLDLWNSKQAMVILDIAITYLITGLLFSIPFLFRWIGHVDEGVHGAPWTFRLIILPGCIVLWPVLLLKYLQARKKTLK